MADQTKSSKNKNNYLLWHINELQHQVDDLKEQMTDLKAELLSAQTYIQTLVHFTIDYNGGPTETEFMSEAYEMMEEILRVKEEE